MVEETAGDIRSRDEDADMEDVDAMDVEDEDDDDDKWNVGFKEAFDDVEEEENRVANRRPINDGEPMDMALRPKTKRAEDEDEDEEVVDDKERSWLVSWR